MPLQGLTGGGKLTNCMVWYHLIYLQLVVMHDMNTSWQQMLKEERLSNSILKWLAMACLVQEMALLVHQILIDSSIWMNWYVVTGMEKRELLTWSHGIGSCCSQSSCMGSSLWLSDYPWNGKRSSSRFITSSTSIEYSQQHCQHIYPWKRWKYREMLTDCQPFSQRKEWWFTTWSCCTWSLSHW